MEGLNKIFCGSDVKNTGICECFFDPKLIEGALAIPLNRVLTNEELLDENIVATMNGLISAAEANRAYPWSRFEDIVDSTAEDTVQTFGYGGTRRTLEGNYNWFFPFIEGGLNLSNALRSFNGLTGKFGFLFYDLIQNILIGTSKLDANGEYGMGGIRMVDFKTRAWRPSTGAAVSVYGTDFSFKPRQINEDIAYKRVDPAVLLLSDIAGLEDIKLTIFSVTTNVAIVQAETDCGAVDVYDLFSAQFAAGAGAAWKAHNAAGTNIPITAATINAGNKGWNVTRTGNWVDGDVITLSAPAVLAAAPVNVVGYEGSEVTIDLGS